MRVYRNSKTAVLVTGHYWNSRRRAGFHHIGAALARAGWQVLFLTAGLSTISNLRGQLSRLQIPEFELNRLVELGENVRSYVWYPPFHPINLHSAILNSIFDPLFRTYPQFSLDPIEDFIEHADVFIFESTPGLFLFERFQSANKNATFIYRVSDDLHTMGVSPLLLQCEKDIIRGFHNISFPCQYILDKYVSIYGNVTQFSILPHGIDKIAFDSAIKSPYMHDKTAIFTGNAYLDYQSLNIMATAFPDFEFHIIGNFPTVEFRENVITHGEMFFIETIPYVKFARIGLHCLEYAPGREAFTDSLKVLQYTYCKLPILAPNYLKSQRRNMFFYEPGDPESITEAFQLAITFDRLHVTEQIASWDDFVINLLSDANI